MKTLSEAPSLKLSRRNFLKTCALGALGTLLYEVSGQMEMSARKLLALPPSLESAKIIEQYRGINFLAPSPESLAGYQFLGEALSEKSLVRSIQIAKKTLDIYPDTILSAAKVNNIVFVKNLSQIIFQHLSPETTQRVFGGINGKAFPDLGCFFLNGIEQEKKVDESILINNFHHELFHMLDDESLNDEWSKLEPWWHYRYSFYKLFQSFDEHNSASFARPYGRNWMDEDKATVAEHLIGQMLPGYNPTLQKKYELMKQFYEKKSQGIMNQAFWDKHLWWEKERKLKERICKNSKI